LCVYFTCLKKNVSTLFVSGFERKKKSRVCWSKFSNPTFPKKKNFSYDRKQRSGFLPRRSLFRAREEAKKTRAVGFSLSPFIFCRERAKRACDDLRF